MDGKKSTSALVTVGLDVGSVAAKAVLYDGERIIRKIAPTGWSPREAGQALFEALLQEAGVAREDVRCIIGTGYGRISLPFVDRSVTEITCHARGAAELVPGTAAVIDVGGQDSKVIKVDQRGGVLDFVMNDKCAAGTGRFLQVTAAALGSDVSELADLAAGQEPLQLNSMCAVFAESEVVSLLAGGAQKGEIVAGLHQSIARRIAGMAGRMGVRDAVTFTGGVARNGALRNALETALGVRVFVPEDCQFAGALGAALIARDMAGRR